MPIRINRLFLGLRLVHFLSVEMEDDEGIGFAWKNLSRSHLLESRYTYRLYQQREDRGMSTARLARYLGLALRLIPASE
jgi:ribosome-binding protein aMBF1 (putative translation factor)